MPNPHDAYFKHTFSDPVHAASALRAVLPQALARTIDWSSLTACSASLVDDDLAESHCDLLFEARIGELAAFLYVLLEHKSWPARMTALQLLRSMVHIWSDHLRRADDKSRLPPIVPVVVFHAEDGWKGDTRFASLVDFDGLTPGVADTLRAMTPDFGFVLDDLTTLDDSTLRRRALTALAMVTTVCLRRMRSSADPIRTLAQWTDVLLASASGSAALLTATFRYIMLVTDVSQIEVARFAQRVLGTEGMETVMTTGERLIQEGLARGRAEGIVNGQRTLLLRLLTTRFGTLPAGTLDRVERATSTELELWAERVLTANNLSAVFE